MIDAGTHPRFALGESTVRHTFRMTSGRPAAEPGGGHPTGDSPYREGYEAHLFRQDTDAFLTYTAIHHCATVKHKTFLKEVESNAQGVTIRTDKGDLIRAKFIADASGGGHVLSKMWNLRDDPPGVRLQSRCLFTHMIDVKPYDDVQLPNGVPHGIKRW